MPALAAFSFLTVEPDDARQYTVEDVDRGSIRTISGKSLSEGMAIRVEPAQPLRLPVLPRGGPE